MDERIPPTEADLFNSTLNTGFTRPGATRGQDLAARTSRVSSALSEFQLATRAQPKVTVGLKTQGETDLI